MSSPFQNLWAWVSEALPRLAKLPLCVLATILMLVATWIILPFDPRGTGLQWFVVFWAKTMLWICRIRVHRDGLAPLDSAQQYVFVSNHASWIDIPVLIASLPFQLTFIAKRELFHMRLVGACLRRTGQIAVDRANTRGFAGGMKRAAEALTRGSRSIMFFPAGTRAATGVGKFKDGAAYFAIRAGMPLVPVALAGTARAMSRGSMRIYGGTVRLTVGHPIPTAELDITARGSLTRRMEEAVLAGVSNCPAWKSPGDGRLGKALSVLN